MTFAASIARRNTTRLRPVVAVVFVFVFAGWLALAGSGFANELPGPVTAEMSPKRQIERAFELVEAADFVVEIDAEDRLDIGIADRRFSRGDLIPFFERLRHKKLIVAIFHKSGRSDAEIAEQVRKLNDYFKKRGFERIVIQQYLGGGRQTYSDTALLPESEPNPSGE